MESLGHVVPNRVFQIDLRSPGAGAADGDPCEEVNRVGSDFAATLGEHLDALLAERQWLRPTQPGGIFMVEFRDENKGAFQGKEDLQQVFLFHGLNYDETNLLAGAVESIEFSDGEVIVEEYEIGKGLYVVLDGEVDVSIIAEDGDRTYLGRLGNGDFFGEMSLVTANLTSARCTAVGEVKVVMIEKLKFDQLVKANTALEVKTYKAFAKVLADRLEVANKERARRTAGSSP